MSTRWGIAFGAVAALGAAALPAEISRKPFGTTAAGQPVEAITLTNRHGVSATIITFAAALQALRAPDRRGEMANIVLGAGDVAGYERNNTLGAMIGRVANRIAGGTFALDGRRYTLPSVDGRPADLHGGPRGFNTIVWQVVGTTADSVTLGLTSPDGDQGFPGTLTVRTTYTLDDDDRLTVDSRATTDKPTIVGLTNHSYYNMAGEGSPTSALANVLTLHAARYTPFGGTPLPLGTIASVAGTPYDFRIPHPVGEHIRDADPQLIVGHGYDHNFVIDGTPGMLRPAARLEDPASGRAMELWTDQPGLQVYTANGYNGTTIGTSGQTYHQHDGIALEPQNFPNAPNQPNFPSARLDPGREYRHLWQLRLSVVQPRASR